MHNSMIIRRFLLGLTLFCASKTASAADHVIETDYFVFTMEGIDSWGTVGYNDATADDVIAQTTEVLDYWGSLLGVAHLPQNDAQKVTVSFNFEKMVIDGTSFPDRNVIGNSSPEVIVNATLSDLYPFTAVTGNSYNTVSAAEAKLLHQDEVTKFGSDATPDINITFNSNFNFFFGTESELNAASIAGATVVDFNTILLHEMAHGLGIFSTMIYSKQLTDGSIVWEKNVLRYSSTGLPVYDEEGNEVFAITQWDAMMNIDPNSFMPGEDITLGEGLDLDVYNPIVWETGSSMSHITEGSDQDAVMNKSVPNGVAYREFSQKELALYGQMGWSFTSQSIPEPGTTTLSLLALTGLLLRRRRAAA